MTRKTRLSCGGSLEYMALPSLHKSSVITFKQSSVATADTAEHALSVALKNEIGRGCGSLSRKNPCPTLIDSARLLGLDKTLGLP